MNRSLVVMISVLSLSTACLVESDEPLVVDLTDAGAFGDTSALRDGSMPEGSETDAGSDAEAGPDAGFLPPTEVGLTIEFDHRFDQKGLFDSAEARGVLAEAARQWGVWLRDDFDTIEAGTVIYTRDPEDLAQEPFIELEQPIDDVLVFVGSAPRDGTLAGASATAAFPPESDDPELRSRLKERWEGADYEPWTGWVSFDDGRNWFFDPTPESGDDIPANADDALSVALHELGHILGVAPGDAFAALVVDGMFQGPNAMEVYGGPVPLADAYGHIAPGVTIDGKIPIMATGKPGGVRYEITRLDLAILADLGYELP